MTTSAVLPLPKIIYGTAWKKERTTNLVVTAVLQGFRAIDTAGQPKHYREDLVGEALEILDKEHGIKREQIWLQSKFTSLSGQDRKQPLPYDASTSVHDQVTQSFINTLKNLHTDYLDSYILHSPLNTVDDTLEAWRVLMTLQDEGKVRLIGVSNTYQVDLLRTLGQERQVQVVQNRWFERNSWDRDVCHYCRSNGIMYQSFWTLSGSPGLLAHPDVISIAQKLNSTPAQIVFRIAQTHGVTPLSGSTNEVRMKDGVKADTIDLESTETEGELKTLEGIIFGRQSQE